MLALIPKLLGSCSLSSKMRSLLVMRLCVSVTAVISSVCTVQIARAQIAPPDMSFHCTPDPVYYQASANCTAHVGGGATGSVAFTLNGGPLATIPLDSNGNATGNTGAFAPGPGLYTLTGTYSGDSHYTSIKRDEVLDVYANRSIVTAETLTCSPYILYAGQPTTCKVHVPGGATGFVTFTTDGDTWGTSALNANGDAILGGGLQSAIIAAHTVQAVYSGDSNFGGFTVSTLENVFGAKVQPQTMSVGCTPAPVMVGQTGNCAVVLTGGATGTVDLYFHDQFLETVTLVNGQGSSKQHFPSMPAGTYAVTAVYSGDANFDTEVTATTVNVTSGTTTPSLGMVCSPVALTPGQPTTCTAQAQSGATGNILFYIDGQWVKTVSMGADSSATLPGVLSDHLVGNAAVTALYNGDANFSSISQGGTVTIATAKTTPTVAVSCTPAAIVSPSVTTCNATVGSGATGALLFSINGNLGAGVGIDASGSAVFQDQFQSAGPGNYTVQVAYQGDQNFNPAAASTGVTVSNAKSTPGITASINPTVIRNGSQFHVAAHVTGGATGYVDILNNGQEVIRLGLSPSGDIGASEHVPTAGDGPGTITFAYSGNANFNPVSTNVNYTISASGAPTDPTVPTNPGPTAPAPGTVLYAYQVANSDGTTGFDPAGNIVAYTDTANGRWGVGYDSLNRITSATQVKVGNSPQSLPPSGGAQQNRP